jgi:ComF family protein
MTTAASLGWIVLDLVASALAPPRCAACDEPVRRLAAFCEACASTVERAPADTKDIAALVYGGAIARAIMRFKYEQRPDLERPLGDLLALALSAQTEVTGDMVVIPVPLHPSRLAERGFNQSALLANRVARRLGAHVLPVALERKVHTAQQAKLGKEARANNLDGAFQTRRGADIRGRRVLLVDDVRTTGATLAAASRALADGGACEVLTAVVARAQ